MIRVVIAVLVSIAVIEVLFRAAYRFFTGRPYRFIPKVPFGEIYFEPHPYLPFVYKKHFLCQKATPATYPLHKGEGYVFGRLKTNNLRHINGPEGDRDVAVPKPKGMIRINCIGGSVTGNYIFQDGKPYSYPMELEKILNSVFPQRTVEVNNCGQGGYTSAEILIKFLLSTIDTSPDIVVFYHGYNDLQVSLTPGFESDYSHAKRNLGEAYHLYKMASLIPDIPLACFNYIINRTAFSQNIRHTLLGAIGKGRADIKGDFKGLDAYKRNIENLIAVCKGKGISVVLATLCHYIYPAIEHDPAHIKYGEGVASENAALRSLSESCGVPLVDCALLVPQEERYFMDSTHLSPEGMMLVAEHIAKPVIDQINKMQHRS